MSTRDPGPPTWAEALAGHQDLRKKCGERVTQLRNYAVTLGAGHPNLASTEGLAVQAEAEWVHWNAYHARAQAFLKVHPAMAGESIYTKCPHDDGGKFPTCWAGADEGWYRLPEAKAVPVASFYEREVGADDGGDDR